MISVQYEYIHMSTTYCLFISRRHPPSPILESGPRVGEGGDVSEYLLEKKSFQKPSFVWFSYALSVLLFVSIFVFKVYHSSYKLNLVQHYTVIALQFVPPCLFEVLLTFFLLVCLQ